MEKQYFEKFKYIDVRHQLGKREMWRRITIDNLADFCVKHNNIGVFTTVQRFCDPNGRKEIQQDQYQYLPLYFDFDDDINFENTQADIKKLRDYLFQAWGLTKTEVRFWFSGRRGFHCEVNPISLGILDLPRNCGHQ